MWKCDVCGEDIEKPEDGWVEAWGYEDAAGKRRERDLRLVHAHQASPRGPGGCQFDEAIERAKGRGAPVDLPLTAYLGSDGLKRLRAMHREGTAPKADVQAMIERLHPGQR